MQREFVPFGRLRAVAFHGPDQPHWVDDVIRPFNRRLHSGINCAGGVSDKGCSGTPKRSVAGGHPRGQLDPTGWFQAGEADKPRRILQSDCRGHR
jgi:hypothetical protein